ncbi:heme ABC transporter ATP-binding protein [Thiomicrospira sp. WB1]|uniref:heme ABC transporter ATP-binding protein n=1 Tax=Thiomicrospira sp. WB1 TaxID=1685380 RepID=UPI0007461D22|nr:heme ABC transporter ATP-binding protein [Thiomicrospira sp. WB1]KUJ71070.1 hypothetical protein AVO41_09370 [Thiomicrospira sp. WB1]
MLEIQQLSIHIQERALIQDVSLRLHPGEIIALLGPNGAGKSTLLKSASGDYEQARSHVWFNGIKLSELNQRSLAQERAVMPQSIHLDFPFKVREVVEMGLLQTLDASSRPDCIRQALDWFDMADHAERNYLTLSGGEQQRVQLARVLGQILFQTHDRPRFLLLDECTASLDITHQHQVFQQLTRLARPHNVGVLAVLHDINLAAQYADTGVLMREGRIRHHGPINKMMTEQAIEETYDFPVTCLRHPKGWPLIIPA